MIFSGFAEGLGIITLMPLIQLFIDNENRPDSYAYNLIENMLEVFNLEPTLGPLLFLLSTLIILKAIFLFISNVTIGYSVAIVISDLRKKLIDALMKAKWSYFVKQPVGLFSNAISSEVNRVSSAYQHVALLIALIIQIFVYFISSLLISWKISLLAMFVGIIVLGSLRKIMNIGRQAGNKQTVLMKTLNSRLTDAINGIKPIKAMGLENRFKPVLNEDIDEIKVAQKRQSIAVSFLQAIQEPILVLLIASAMFVLITYWEQHFSSLLIMSFLFYRLTGKILNAQLCYQEVITQESALWSINSLADEAKKNTESNLSKEKIELSKNIEFKNVCFSYDNNIVLNNINLEIPFGKITTLYGASGTGKTTIADLIACLQLPDSGDIFIDGTSTSRVNIESWRSQIGYVPQEMFLFHDSIENNISLGDKTIKTDDIYQALKLAEAEEFVDSLENGIKTIIGEKGASLSGGQRQRLSLARALARKPNLLILDEVTTSLDPNTEKEICLTLTHLKNTLTILAISHQQALLEIADNSYDLNIEFIKKK